MPEERILVIQAVQVLLDALLHLEEVRWVPNLEPLLGELADLSLDDREDLLLSEVLDHDRLGGVLALMVSLRG